MSRYPDWKAIIRPIIRPIIDRFISRRAKQVRYIECSDWSLRTVSSARRPPLYSYPRLFTVKGPISFFSCFLSKQRLRHWIARPFRVDGKSYTSGGPLHEKWCRLRSLNCCAVQHSVFVRASRWIETAMADMAGLLPTIKCSNCNAEVEISAMAEHVCVQVPQGETMSFVWCAIVCQFTYGLSQLRLPRRLQILRIQFPTRPGLQMLDLCRGLLHRKPRDQVYPELTLQ